MTLNSPSNYPQLKLGNIINLEPPSQQSHNQEKPGQKFTNKFSPTRSGDIGEHTVITEAWKRGAEVYPNAGGDGKTDLILEIEGTLYQINVKSANLKLNKTSKGSKWSWRANNAAKVKPPIWALTVEPRDDGYIVRWPTKWGRNQPPLCPPGLEKFWD